MVEFIGLVCLRKLWPILWIWHPCEITVGEGPELVGVEINTLRKADQGQNQ
jgi:hypothetical protein